MNLQQTYLTVGAMGPPQYVTGEPLSVTPNPGGHGVIVWSAFRPGRQAWRLYATTGSDSGMIPDTAKFVGTVVIPPTYDFPGAPPQIVHVFAEQGV